MLQTYRALPRPEPAAVTASHSGKWWIRVVGLARPNEKTTRISQNASVVEPLKGWAKAHPAGMTTSPKAGFIPHN